MKRIILLLVLAASIVTAECAEKTICLDDVITAQPRYNETQICADCACTIYFIDNQGQKFLEDYMTPILNISEDEVGMLTYQLTYPIFQPENKYTAYYTCGSGSYSGSACIEVTTRDCYADGNIGEVAKPQGILEFFINDNYIMEEDPGTGGGGGGGGAGGPGVLESMKNLAEFIVTAITLIPKLLLFITGTFITWLLIFIDNPMLFFQETIYEGVKTLLWTFFLANSLLLMMVEACIMGLTILNGGTEPLKFMKTYMDYHVRLLVWIFEKTKQLIDLGVSVVSVIIDLVGVIGNTIGQIIPG